MKRFRAIALTLIILLISAFCLTACDKKTEGIVSSEQIKGQYSKVAELVLTARRIDENGEGYHIEKAQIENQIENKISALGSTFLDDLVAEVLGVSGVKNSYLSKYLSATKNYLINTYQTVDLLNGLTVKYPVMKSLAELAQELHPEFELQEDMLGQVTAYALSLPMICLTDSSLISSAIDELVYYKGTLTGAEYNSTINALEKLYQAGKTLASTANIELLVKITINFALSDKSFSGVYAKLSAERKLGVDQVLNTLVNDFGLQDQAKKQAYIDFVGVIFANEYQTQVNTTYANSFDDILDIAESYANEDEEYFNLFTKSLNKRGNALYRGAFSIAEREKLISASKILDRQGLGYFVEKYLPLYATVQELVGVLLNEIEQDDLILAVYLSQLYLNIDEMEYTETQKNKVKSQTETLAKIVMAKVIINAYDEYSGKSELKNAFTKAFGSESLLNLTQNGLREIASYYPSNAQSTIFSIMQANDPLNQSVCESVNGSFALLVLIWGTADYVQEGFIEAKETIVEYFSPVLDLIEIFGYGEYIQMGKDMAGQINSVQDFIALISNYIKK